MKSTETVPIMTSEELKAARKALKYSQAELACALDTPKRTIQDWEGGKCRLPGVLGVAMGLLREKDEAVMTWIAEKIKRDLKGLAVSTPEWEQKGGYSETR